MIKLCIDCDYMDETGDFSCKYPGKKSLMRSGNSGKSCDAERLPTWPFDILFNACGKRGRWWRPEMKIGKQREKTKGWSTGG
jgi:hypothetical protein